MFFMGKTFYISAKDLVNAVANNAISIEVFLVEDEYIDTVIKVILKLKPYQNHVT